MVAHAWNLRTGEVEARECDVQGHLQLYNKFKVCLKNETTKTKELGVGKIPYSSLYDPKILGALISTLGVGSHSPKPRTDSPIAPHDILTWAGWAGKGRAHMAKQDFHKPSTHFSQT